MEEYTLSLDVWGYFVWPDNCINSHFGDKIAMMVTTASFKKVDNHSVPTAAIISEMCHLDLLVFLEFQCRSKI